jgi:hypothetical protein
MSTILFPFLTLAIPEFLVLTITAVANSILVLVLVVFVVDSKQLQPH